MPPTRSPRPPTAGLLAALALVISVTNPLSVAAGDRGADGQFSRRRSSHFVLLQDVDIDHTSGRDGSRQFERDVLEILEEAHREVAGVLGVRPRGTTRVVIYDPAVFAERFDALFRFQTAGFFDGVIHVRGNTRVDPRLVRTLHHEYVHAALQAAAPAFAFPGWVNEGLAEWFENRSVGKRRLSVGERAVLVEASRQGTLPGLVALQAPAFGGLGPAEAGLAYLYSFAAIEHLARRHGERRLETLCEQLIRTRNLDRALARAFRLELDELEAGLRDELR